MKNLPSFESFVNESSMTDNYKQYEELCKSYPHFKKVLEDLGTAPRYAINEIWERDNEVIFYMNQSFSIRSSFCDLMKKYDVEVQVPGNQDYNFSVSVNKK
jgi:hypothetical protein